MKILFLCGALENGKDGVGDYTRRLAEEIIRKGHEASIVALNDHFLSKECEEYQDKGGVSLSVLRIPANWSLHQRFKRAKKWIDIVNPDLLSLQFVIFSIHSKGLPFRSAKFFLQLREGRYFHVMFHELWVGMDSKAGLKSLLWGTLQRQIIKSFTKKVQPDVVHTQTRFYQKRLRQLGIAANYLPLFSNIPVASTIRNKAHPLELIPCSEKELVFVMFGGIHAGTPIHEFASEVAKYAEAQHVKVVLQFIGRNGSEQRDWATVWQSFGLSVESLGEQTAEDISYVLQNASVGISTTPYALTEKSGTVAAMLEHGLPVICVARAWKSRGIYLGEGSKRVVEYKPGRLQQILTFSKEDILPGNVSFIAERFLSDLDQFS